jgi:MFS family permease
MFQSPVGGGGPASQRPEAPQQVVNASRLMYLGAAISAIDFVVGLTTLGSLKNAFRTADPHLTSSQINADVGAALGVDAFFALLGIGLWLWMAYANRRGRSWARVIATVLFALDTLLLMALILQPHLAYSLIVQILIWLAGLGAIILLWMRESSAYYQTVSQMPR